MNCQLTNLDKIIIYNTFWENLSQSKIDKTWSIKKNVKGLYKKFSTFSSDVKIESSILEKNDIVTVKSKSDINLILNKFDSTGGCVFAPEMFKFCGKTFIVYKAVDVFYDEVKNRMCKCKNIVLLKGALCSGKRKMLPSDCDRNCFFFWHTSWLKKID